MLTGSALLDLIAAYFWYLLKLEFGTQRSYWNFFMLSAKKDTNENSCAVAEWKDIKSLD
jgi:hypothetical protein